MKRTWRGRSRAYSGSTGSLTFRTELRLAPHFVDAGQPGAHRAVLLVANPAAGAGAALDQDLVAGLGEGADARRRHRDALLAGLDLAGAPTITRRPGRSEGDAQAGDGQAFRRGR